MKHEPTGRERFIPTRMGNTSRRKTATWQHTVHPHTHGEHDTELIKRGIRLGSSPHAWGTHGRVLPAPLRDRFIPTRMGNTYATQEVSA